MNTMSLPCIAEHFTVLESDEAIANYFQMHNEDVLVLVLGGGSNVILPERITQAVVQLGHNFIDVTSQADEHVLINVGASVVWDDLVAWSVEQGLHGLENLSLIPGLVGAAPVQNIGAYGVELKDSLVSVRAFDRKKNAFIELDNAECLFAYRDSVFKRSNGRLVITEVRLNLSKVPAFVLEYGELKALRTNDVLALSLQAVRDKVIEVRQAKLPDPKQLPNTGSFFKNPVISQQKFEELKQCFPGLAGYPQSSSKNNGQSPNLDEGEQNAEVKIAAGWLIDHAGLKGHCVGGMCVHEKQALVLINKNDASQNDVIELAEFVHKVVLERYGICLEVEPVVIGRDAF